MVYQFKITSTENPDFILQVEADDEHTFSDLHGCIQQACNFDPSQLASFFMAGPKCGSQIEISQLDYGQRSPNYLSMAKTPLKSVLNKESQKMVYVFDFFTDRLFFIEQKSISMGKSLTEPEVTYKNGKTPTQAIEEEKLKQESKRDDECLDYGDLDDYTEIFGEMEDLAGGI